MNKTADIKIYQELGCTGKKVHSMTDFLINKNNSTTLQAKQPMQWLCIWDWWSHKYKTAVIDALIKDIRNRNNALTAGDIGYRYVLRALEDAGRSDVIFEMNSRDDVPGYGYQLKHGATALTESWQAYESVSQ